MTDTALKLTDEKNQPTDILPFERRRATRRPVSGQVTTLRSEESALRKISSLKLQDLSDTGLCAFSDEALKVNTFITLFFQPHGPDGGFDAPCRVVRCLAQGSGYEVGFRFDAQSAAA